MSRKFLITRWDEKNCQVQCAGCNVFKYGEQYKFSVWLDSNLGEGTADFLLQKSRATVKLTDHDLLQKIEIYQQKIADLNK